MKQHSLEQEWLPLPRELEQTGFIRVMRQRRSIRSMHLVHMVAEVELAVLVLLAEDMAVETILYLLMPMNRNVQ